MTQKTPNQTKDKIILVATEMFTRLGYDASSIYHIAKNSGLTKATMYHHFGSKQNILEICAENYVNDFIMLSNSKAVKQAIKLFYQHAKDGCLIFNLLSTPNYQLVQHSVDEFIYKMEEMLGEKLIDLMGALMLRRVGLYDLDPVKKFYESL